MKRVVGYSKSPSTTDRARQLGVIDVRLPPPCSPWQALTSCWWLCPVAATESHAQGHQTRSPQMLIMDVGSTKADVVRAARRALRDQVGSFVPAHPITGREVAGVEHADASCITAVRSF